MLSDCDEAVFHYHRRHESIYFNDPIYDDLALQKSCNAKVNETDALELLRQGDENSIISKCQRVLKAILISRKELNVPADAHVNIPAGAHANIPAGAHANRSALYRVPNRVHYVSLGRWQFSFLNYISFKSASIHLKPDAIYIHGDSLPYGDWWNRMLSDVPNVYFVERPRPSVAQGRKVGWLEHSSDLLRLQTLYGT